MELPLASYPNSPQLEAMIELWKDEMTSSLSLSHRRPPSDDRSALRVLSFLKNLNCEALLEGDFMFACSEEGDLSLQSFDPQSHDSQRARQFNQGPAQILLQKLYQLQSLLVELPFERIGKTSFAALEEKCSFRSEIQALQQALLNSQPPPFERLLSYLRFAKGRLLNRIDMPLSVRGKILNQVRRTVDPESIEMDIYNREISALAPGHRTHSEDHERLHFPYPVYSEKALRRILDLELLILAWRSEVFPD